VHELIAAPFLGEQFVLRPEAGSGVRLPRAAYDELAAAPAITVCPPWLADAARRAFGLDLAGSVTVSSTYHHAVVPSTPNPAPSQANVSPFRRYVKIRSACCPGFSFRQHDPIAAR